MFDCGQADLLHPSLSRYAWSSECQAGSKAGYVPIAHGAAHVISRVGHVVQLDQPAQSSSTHTKFRRCSWENLLFNLSDQPTATNAAQLTPRSTPTSKFWYVVFRENHRYRRGEFADLLFLWNLQQPWVPSSVRLTILIICPAQPRPTASEQATDDMTLQTSRSFRRRSRAMFCSSSCESAAGKYVETEPFN